MIKKTKAPKESTSQQLQQLGVEYILVNDETAFTLAEFISELEDFHGHIYVSVIYPRLTDVLLIVSPMIIDDNIKTLVVKNYLE